MCPTITSDHRCAVRVFAGADAPDLDAQHPDVHHARAEALSRLDWERGTVEAHHADRITMAETTEEASHWEAVLHAERVVLDVVVERVAAAIAPEDVSDPGLLNEVTDLTRRGLLDLAAALEDARH